MEEIENNEQPGYYRSVLQQTVDAFYDAAVAEIKRLARRPPDPGQVGRIEKRMYPINKRMDRAEAAKHRALVRWLQVRRLREAGYKLEEIGDELGFSRQRAEQILSSPEPVRWNR